MVVRRGGYYRKSDSRHVKRFRCLHCQRSFSEGTFDPRIHQKKRLKNKMIFELFASGVSQRRIARVLRISRHMVARRLIYLAARAREEMEFDIACRKVRELEFDEMETSEHSKCKPISIPIAVEAGTRRILAFEVASMSAKGRLTKKSLKLYGKRLEERRHKRRLMFRRLQPIIYEDATIKSDSNPHYMADVKEFFPNATYIQVPGIRGAVTGQGELKKVKFDPIFSLNHTAAMLRANVSSLIRQTWCTTKRKERLADRLAIYAVYHNRHLK